MKRRAVIACAALLSAALLAQPSSEATGQQATGRVSGTVKLTTMTGGRSSASAYESRSVAPRAKAQPEARNVIIFFEGMPAAQETQRHATIAQRDEQFLPHVVAVTTGSSVSFPNEDPFFHNVFSLSRGAVFDLGRYPSGATRSREFTRPGIVKVFCHIHSHMSAVVRVFDHPWFTIPDEEGEFAIDGVPAGERMLVAWHERIGERRERVTIRPGQATTIAFTLPVLEPAK
jgi:plastocyanin